MAIMVKGAPFRYTGAINVEDCKTSQEVIEKANLDWEVDKFPVWSAAHDEFGVEKVRTINNVYSIVRKDNYMPLGIVKGRYTPVQNKHAFKFFDDAIGKNQAIWQTAGYFGDGERVFISAKLPNTILVNGDPVDNYLVFTTSHDGSSGVKILFTPIRVICQNTLNAAIKQANNYVSFRHTPSVHSNINIAHEILGICKKKTEFVSEIYNEMSTIKVTDTQVKDYFASVILSDNEIVTVKNTGHTLSQIVDKNWFALQDTGISMKKANVLNDINNYYFTGIGQKQLLGTMWGAYNAVTGYYSNVDNSEGIKRMDSLLYGDKSKKIQLAGNLVF